VYRGRGIGKQLLLEALRFCTEKKYKAVSLWTTNELAAAHHLYTNAGFRKMEEIAHPVWGKEVVEERYELLL
jgi:ribosomal protein S18 acetylase RimI-like enzyme